MQNTFLFITICFFFMTSCQERKHITNTPDIRDTTSEFLRKKLIGKWGWADEVTYLIKADSIYDVQKDSTYPYRLKGDTFMVRFSPIDTFNVWGKLKVIEDTLQIIDYNMNNFVTYGYRIKE